MKNAEMILRYLQTHPQSYRLVRRGYQNAIEFHLDDTLIFPEQQELFPLDGLNAFALDESFIPNHKALVAWLSDLIFPFAPHTPAEIWLTLSRVSRAKALLIEVSFE